MLLEQLSNELASVAQLGPIESRLAQSSRDANIIDVVHDSRAASPGSLFCAVAGLTVDGHDYVSAAATKGATAALVERWIDTDVAQLKVSNVRFAMAHVAAIVHGHPSSSLDMFGITGTNGKTTTTQLFSSIMNAAGRDCSVIGTLGGVHTTPESTDLQRQLRDLISAGSSVVALEVSSHALDQRRVEATEFAVAAFSNLTPDHLDYHGDMESYFDAKKRLFDGRARVELINVDDPWGQKLANERPNAVQVSLNNVDITGSSLTGSDFVWRGHQVRVNMPGRMNVANALMAAEAAHGLAVDDGAIAAGLASAENVPGRMEIVGGGGATNPTVVVDYSHTPDSIERALATVRDEVGEGRVAIVFGCGGDRDRLKRPLMGRAAEAGADVVYLTSDNPRTEDPLLIIVDALAGISQPDDVIVEPDRRIAIKRAIMEAGPDDVVLIAGKGHEKTQTIGSDVLPLDDCRVARDAFEVTPQ